MSLETFLALGNWLSEYTPLKESRKHFSVQQKLAMFLYIVGERASNRAVQKKFQYSDDTVSYLFHEVLSSLLHFVLHSRIADNTK